MIALLKLVIVTSVLVLGATIITQEGMLLYSIRKWADKKKNKIYQALILCPWCMPSIWAVAGYFISVLAGIVVYDIKILYAYPVVVCGSSIVSGYSWSIYIFISSATDNLKR